MSGNFFDNYPYTDFHELNLDWIIKQIKDLNDRMTEFDALNDLTWRGNWNIAEPYAIWSVVQDTNGDGYVSTKAVPVGVEISNTDYWSKVAQYDQIYKEFNDRITANTNAIDVNAKNISTNSENISLETDRAKKAENTINNRISSIISQANTENTEIVDGRNEISGFSFKTVGENIRFGQNVISDLFRGNENLFLNNTPYKGYLTETGPSSGYEAGFDVSETSWNFFIIHVRKNSKITISGFSNISGAKNLWLNSANPIDVNSVASVTNSTNGTYTCKTEYIGISAYNVISDINNINISYNISDKLLKKENLTSTGFIGDNVAISDIQNISNNSSTIYTFYFTSGQTNIPENLPFTSAPYEDIYQLITIGNSEMSNGLTATRYIITGHHNDIWVTEKRRDSWRPWTKRITSSIYEVSKNGTGYSSFSQAVIDARRYNNSVIIVHEGEYDLQSELIAIYPNFFTNYTANQTDGRGLGIGNNMTIIFDSTAKLVFNYSGDNENVVENFSPLNALPSNYKLYGVNIDCKNVRYAIHDDPINGKSNPWKHIYKNCNLNVDNSNSPKTFRACIGGGLGQQSTIIIKDCVFNSVGVDNLPDNNIHRKIVSYHNCINNNSKSYVVMSGNYFVNGTCGGSYYGPSTLITNMVINNNSVSKTPPYISQETSQYTNINVVMNSWNNEVR